MVTSGRAVIDLVLPPTAETPRRARQAVSARYGSHARCGDILVCVSEAVTNAVLHALSPVRLVVREAASALRFEISDEDPTAPVGRDPDPATPTGRGLLLIGCLADRWGVDLRDDGKTLWFEVARS